MLPATCYDVLWPTHDSYLRYMIISVTRYSRSVDPGLLARTQLTISQNQHIPNFV